MIASTVVQITHGIIPDDNIFNMCDTWRMKQCQSATQ